MDWTEWVAALMAVGLAGTLLAALLRPEWFS